jgi:hypothetical protein
MYRKTRIKIRQTKQKIKNAIVAPGIPIMFSIFYPPSAYCWFCHRYIGTGTDFIIAVSTEKQKLMNRKIRIDFNNHFKFLRENAWKFSRSATVL